MSSDFIRKLKSDEQKCLQKEKQPDWTDPMLATLTEKRFSDPGWIYERKLDGERALAFRTNDGVRLMTRNRKCINDNYPEIVDAFGSQNGEFIVDGEIVAFSGNITSFSKLQERMQKSDPEAAQATGISVYMYLFDIIHLDGYALAKLPLRARKRILRHAVQFDDPLRFTAHRNEHGEQFFDEACGKGWEGIIAKQAQSEYVHSRSRSWLKFKCSKGQELVIGGFTAPAGSRKGFGALLVGYYDDGDLCYAGKVGTGFDEDFLQQFGRRLSRIERESPPFTDDVPSGDDITWVTPKYVGEFEFTEWTTAGRLRHPRFVGLRRDKNPKDVVREASGDD